MNVMTASVKTAISIKKPLLEEANKLAQTLQISRSHLFSLAIESYIQKYQNRVLLEEVNRAIRDQPDLPENSYLTKARKSQKKVLDGEW